MLLCNVCLYVVGRWRILCTPAADDEYSPGASPAAADAKDEPAKEEGTADGAMDDADGGEGKTDAPPAAAAAPTGST